MLVLGGEGMGDFVCFHLDFTFQAIAFLILQYHVSIGYHIFQIFSPRSCAFLRLLHLVRDICKHLSSRALVAMTVPYQQWSVLFLFLHSRWTLCGWSCLYSTIDRLLSPVVHWMFVSSQNAHFEILSHNLMVLGGRGSGRYIGHEDVGSWMGLVLY